jgi:hypothetical protein
MSSALHELYGTVLRDRLPQVGIEIYELLYMAQRPLPDICDWTGLSLRAVIEWRDRIRKELREIELQLEAVDVYCEDGCAVAM